MALLPPAKIIRRRRRRKTDGAPPSQPKLSATAAAKLFTARQIIDPPNLPSEELEKRVEVYDTFAVKCLF